ncbi:hypothetical protein PFICI_03619 [Pestalotiopsis fici W106-1]|uniref:DyP dimeric alpha+beta barrel domain-containing protein n=1 Tax=Pestalotiopsis fici (strain W106-1 / CGMCC3.15140) TaxID=1229662 RepID=W3XHW4_PESFW|nr:uncharacterized protein PFICI_03619 [Pestalotiopsis fici W106-1]ETS85594.1 hypothetical protein PFICI_03619 [Pestalotiopsis fici W106-1]
MGDAQIPLQHNGALPPLDLKNIQGDILEGIAKKVQTFFFFRIKADHAASFRNQLTHLLPLITSAKDARSFREEIKDAKRRIAPEGHQIGLIENSSVNIAFSQFGLTALGITDDIKDGPFKIGQKKDAVEKLGDKLEDWDPAFKNDVHGVILVAASHQHVLNRGWDRVKHIFHVGHKDASIEVVKELDGKLRPGAEKGHEHFGFNDGLSQPSVKGVSAPDMDGPHDGPVDQGIILVGREGDNGDVPPGAGQVGPGPVSRPSWAIDGSFLAFRYLKQLVPEFDAFLEKSANAADVGPEIPREEVKDLLGARLVGRWKSGAPVQLAPGRDDPSLAAPDKNQNFRFNIDSQELCPYAAHIRKTNPRGDLDSKNDDGTINNNTDVRRIIRRGITFGPEVTPEERESKKSSSDDKLERGLLFACYQSNIANGFEFLQNVWANNPDFPFPPNGKPGFDPLIGVAPAGTVREMEGAFKNDLTKPLTLTADWVISRGGEYFFSPSIPALKKTFAKKA